METLKELRVKYKQLKKEGDDIYNKIRIFGLDISLKIEV